jgi:putative flippase GtrA
MLRWAVPLRNLWRFAVVGAACFFLGTGSLYLLTDLAGLNYLVSLTFSMVIVNALGWLLNRLWTFKSRSVHRTAEIRRYFAASLLGSGITFALMALLVSGLGINYIVASAFVAVLMMLVNFMMHKNWSFATLAHDRPRPNSDPTPGP